jgi:hypothetical protein
VEGVPIAQNQQAYIDFALIRYRKNEMDTTDPDIDATFNELAWFIFLSSDNKERIDTAIVMIEGVVRRANYKNHFMFLPLDTYANLLYKKSLLFHAGDTENAVTWEEKALAEASLVDISQRKIDVENTQSIIDKMKKGVHTWPDKTN